MLSPLKNTFKSLDGCAAPFCKRVFEPPLHPTSRGERASERSGDPFTAAKNTPWLYLWMLEMKKNLFYNQGDGNMKIARSRDGAENAIQMS